MVNIYDTLKNLIGPDLVSKAATTLGESNAKVSTAVSAIIPSLLGKLIKEGNTSGIRETIEMAGKNDLVNDLNGIFGGNCIYNNINVGDKLAGAILGNKTSEFNSAVAAKAGIPTASAGKLTHMVSTAIAAFLGNRMAKHNDSMADILAELDNEKAAIARDIPANIYTLLGLSPVLGNRTTTATNEPVAKKSGNGWIWWVIILLLLLLCWFWWRSCHRNKVVDNNRTAYVEHVDTVRARPVATVDDNTTRNGVRTEVTLPDGRKINVYKGGAEDNLVTYLNSDYYKNANDNDLKSKWFEFDNIEFQFDSADELTAGSKQQLDNLVQVLKAYPDVKIRIGGYADKVGSDPANMKISKERAEYIKSYFESNGVNGNRVDTRGFGEEYAQYPADAPDSLRAHDRNIALRIVK